MLQSLLSKLRHLQLVLSAGGSMNGIAAGVGLGRGAIPSSAAASRSLSSLPAGEGPRAAGQQPGARPAVASARHRDWQQQPQGRHSRVSRELGARCGGAREPGSGLA